MSRKEYMLTQMNVMRTYLRLLILPVNQNVDYDYPRSKSLQEPKTFFSFLLLVAIFSYAMVVFKRQPLMGFGIFWFFLTLSVESLVTTTDVINEHRLYLPMVGYSIFLITTSFHALGIKDLRRMMIPLLLIITCYSVLTYRRNFIWKDELTLWGDAVRKSPEKARVYSSRGIAYHMAGDFDKALLDYTKAIALSPNRMETAHTNRGTIYFFRGNIEEAISEYTKAMAINSHYKEAFYNRGLAYSKKGDFLKAISDYTQAITIDPSDAQYYYNRGNAFFHLGDLDQAIIDYDKAIEIRPNFRGAYHNRGIAFLKKSNMSQVRSMFGR